ncbi:hypothetical protein MMC21_000637 [Puttea exsequens]|nr:hypothetical protein [Puttea exsequens]
MLRAEQQQRVPPLQPTHHHSIAADPQLPLVRLAVLGQGLVTIKDVLDRLTFLLQMQRQLLLQSAAKYKEINRLEERITRTDPAFAMNVGLVRDLVNLQEAHRREEWHWNHSEGVVAGEKARLIQIAHQVYHGSVRPNVGRPI